VVSGVVIAPEKSSWSFTASTYPVEFSALPVRGYRISDAVSAQKPDYAVAQPEDSFEWVSVFKIPLHRLHSCIYRLVEPIEVQVERYGNGYLVTDENVNRHGVGSTIADALRDYEEILLSYFESLSRRQDRLSSKLKHDLEFLGHTISHT